LENADLYTIFRHYYQNIRDFPLFGGVLMKMLDLYRDDKDLIQQAAFLLVEGFKDTGSTSWLSSSIVSVSA
jgi:hypothetical protein